RAPGDPGRLVPACPLDCPGRGRVRHAGLVRSATAHGPPQPIGLRPLSATWMTRGTRTRYAKAKVRVTQKARARAISTAGTKMTSNARARARSRPCATAPIGPGSAYKPRAG